MVHDDGKDKGREYLDDTPVAVPVKFRGVPSGDRVRELMHTLIRDMRDREGVETFEESLDFEVDDDDPDLSSVVSHSEQRYMTEEKLLTEAVEADKVVLQRRAAAQFRRKYHGEGESGARKQRGGDGDSRSDDGVDKRGEKRESEGRAGEVASGGGGASKGG